jgi:prevent-host-death family protein
MRNELELVPVTALRTRAIDVLDAVEDRGGPFFVTRHGRPVAVLLSVSSYERLERDRLLLRALALGEMESVAGEGCDLEDVLADAESLLAEN